jgi:uncharacterized protein (DUF362 family)/Pyruvate/2-oxoacid:ferredoxin oxidoreductase delta subunit
MSLPVSFARCESYDLALDAVRRALEPLGGPARFFRPGQRVLLKPNLLSDGTPEQGITTHPEIARAVIRLAREAGAVPSVGDSPAGALRVRAVWEKTGFRALCDAESVPLLNLEQEGSRTFTCAGTTLTIAAPVLDADLVVNLPKVKTHSLTVFTGAVKNLYGTLPGFQKATLHKLFPSGDELSRLVAELAAIVRPGLSIADGIVGMEGNGPSGGEPVRLGFVAASADPGALDSALCRVLGIPHRAVPVFRHLPPGSWEDPPLLGEPPAPGTKTLRLPATWKSRLIPRPLVRLLAPLFWIRPALDPAVCVRCGRCADACPPKALIFEKGDIPRLLGSRCIGCCCCHEVCPVKAIRMTESPLMRRISRGRLTAS